MPTVINDDGRFTPIHANVTEQGRECLADFCAAHGITISGLLQAMCNDCTQWVDREEDPKHPLAWLVAKARAVDTERRKRARKPKSEKQRGVPKPRTKRAASSRRAAQ